MKELTLLLVTILPMLGTRQMKASVSHFLFLFLQAFQATTTICSTMKIYIYLDTLARLSVYTVPSSASSYTALLPHFLPPRSSLLQTLVLIVLDWTRPWTFIEELQTWLTWVEMWSKGDSSRELEIIREESRERRKFHLLFCTNFKKKYHS